MTEKRRQTELEIEPQIFSSLSPEETIELGKGLARKLKPGDLVSVEGEVGAGKTTWVKGIAQGLGISEQITSPSYLLIQEHRSGRMPLFHVDAYRIVDPGELVEIGVEDYLLEGTGVTVIEWGEKLEGRLPLSLTVRVHIKIVGLKERAIEIIPLSGGKEDGGSFKMG